MSNVNRTSTVQLDRRAFLQKAASLGLGAAALPLAESLLFPIEAAAADVALTMFIWSGGEQGTVAREVVKDFVKGNAGAVIEFYEESNAVAYPKMLAAQQADPTKPLVNFGYFNSAVTFRGDQDKMWLPLDFGQDSEHERHLPRLSQARRHGRRSFGVADRYRLQHGRREDAAHVVGRRLVEILPTRAGSSCSTIFGPTRASCRQRA